MRGTNHFTDIGIPRLWQPFIQSCSKASDTSKAPDVYEYWFYVTNKTWFPDINDTGSDYKLSKGLKPLERHKNDMAIIQGCQHQFSNEAHWGSTFWLTGANRYAIPGQKFNNTISADQVAARQFGKNTRFSSIQIDSKRANNEGHGPGLSLA